MRIALAAELDPWAHKTYATNHPEVPVKRVLLKDLTAEDAVQSESLTDHLGAANGGAKD